MIIAANLLSILLGSYVSVAAAAYFGQGYIQYNPSHRDARGLGIRPYLPWRDENGNFLGYIRPSENPKRVIVFFHGMGGEALNWAWYSKIIPDDNLLVLAEYPGYGAKSGQPSESTLFHSSEVLLDRIQERWPLPITVVGESLGSGVACYVASRRPVDRLALVSPFTSVVDVAKSFAPFLPVGVMLKDKFQSVNYLKSMQIPLHVLHGSNDKVVPVGLGRQLYLAYPGVQKKFTELRGFNHFSINTALVNSPLAEPFRQFMIGQDAYLSSEVTDQHVGEPIIL